MDATDPLKRDDCPIKCLGIDPDGKTYWFLNDKVELISLTEDVLGSDEGLLSLFTKKESQKWARRYWPSKLFH